MELSGGKAGAERRRVKKSKAQVEILKSEFRRNPEWCSRTLQRLAETTGFTPAQLYKWNWD